jgi:diguanylate cyclase (GGDEF)-like protein
VVVGRAKGQRSLWGDFNAFNGRAFEMEGSANLPEDALRSIVELVAEPACLIAVDGWRILYANPAFGRLANANSERASWEVGGLFAAFPDLDSAAVRMQLNELVQGNRLTARIDCASAHRHSLISEIRARRIETAGGALLALVLGSATAEDADAARGKAIDPLTGLADRAFILDKLNNILRGDRQEDRGCVVLFVDVDGFKQVNDSYGHLMGDRVLGEVARRLAASVRARDHVARFGGDEFLVLLERVSDRAIIERVVQRIQAAFDRPIVLPQGEVTLSVSVGAAQAGDAESTTAEALIDAADRAMYAAKRATA